MEDKSSKKFIKFLDKGLYTSTSGADGQYSAYFIMNDLGEVTSFANIFDQYKVTRLTLHVKAASQLALPSTASAYSSIAIVPDYDDSTGISYANALNYPAVRLLAPGQSTSFSIRPHCNIGPTDAEQNVVSPWIDFSQANTPHLGFKIVVKQSTSTSLNYWQGVLEVEFLGRYIR